MKNCIILHIEDDDLDHALFERDLAKLRFDGQYQRAESLDEAKRSLAQCVAAGAECPDLIIADSKLGIYNGLDIVQWLKAQPELKDIPVVVYSGAISPTQGQAVLEAGQWRASPNPSIPTKRSSLCKLFSITSMCVAERARRKGLRIEDCVRDRLVPYKMPEWKASVVRETRISRIETSPPFAAIISGRWVK